MNKHYLILAGVLIAGFVGGIMIRGVSDSKGWTTGTP